MDAAVQLKLLEELLAIEVEDPVGEWDLVYKKYQPKTRHPDVFVRAGESHIVVSAEDGGYFCDYYGEHRGDMSWIHPVLEAFAMRNGLYWEWENPGSIALYKA